MSKYKVSQIQVINYSQFAIGGRVAAEILVSLILLTCFLFTSVALADQAMLATSPSIACMTMTDKNARVEYPEFLLTRKEGGVVPVELVFHAPNEAPKVKVTDDTAYYEMIRAVERYVVRFRMPCMEVGDPPVTIRQSYVFQPNDGRKVMVSETLDAADEARHSQLACITHVNPGSIPDYPKFSRRNGEQGKFFVEMRFTASDTSPELKLLAASKSPLLRASVEKYVEGYRMSCLKSEPLTVKQLIYFELSYAERYILKDSTLKTLIRSAREVPQPAYFDFNTMGCPFDLRMKYFRPYSTNSVKELENSNPARAPLLNWLSMVTLKLREDDNIANLGNEFTVTIPCGKLNL